MIFEFDLDGIDLSIYTCPVNLEEQYAYTVLLSEGRSAEIKLEWSSLVGMYEVSFDTGYNMNTTNTVFSIGDIRRIFSHVEEICGNFHKERVGSRSFTVYQLALREQECTVRL